MGLRAVVESLDGIEGAADFYTQAEDGKYYLEVEGVDNLPAVQGLATTLKKYKEAAPSAHGLKAKLERLDELEAFGGLEMTPDEVRERVQELEELRASGGEDVDKRIEELRETYEKRKAAAVQQEAKKREQVEQENQTLQQFVERLTIDNALERALDKVEVIPSTREAVKALLKQRGPKVVKDGDDYRGIFETDLGDLDISDYVETWSKRDEAAPFMPASGNKGSGAKGQNGAGGTSRANPFSPDNRNVSEQMRIAKENPRLAQQLAAEAGVKLPKIAA